MKDLENKNYEGRDRLKKICDILRTETLEPAQQEAQAVREQAQVEAQRLIEEGKKQAESLIARARVDLEKERTLFESSLVQASHQAIAKLSEEIEKQIFNAGVSEWLRSATSDPTLAARLIEALVKAVEQEGTSADFSAAVGSTIKPEEVNRLLAVRIREQLRGKGVAIGSFAGGVQLTLHDERLMLDISADALTELVAKYLRKDFRRHLFVSPSHG